jgi:hypoxanthine phosphoribosyltransferase
MTGCEIIGDDSAPRAWKGLDTSRMPVFLSYDRVERMVAALLPEVERWRPDHVVGIARGGIVPAAMAAGILALPLSFVRHEKATGAITWIDAPAAGRRILLIDDCCSSGATLDRARQALRAEGRECLTMAVVYDPDVARHVPDLSHPMRELFRLPWERGEATPTGRAAKASGPNLDQSVEAPFVGFGVDEPLLAKIAGSGMPFPPLPHDRAVLISGRPDSERPGILAALTGTVCEHLPLLCGEAPIGTDSMAIARSKAEAATRFGCTHFIECNAEQAIGIATHASHLITTWWSIEAGTGWIIGAVAQPSPRPGI